jgi:hypothetical protein
MSMGCVHTHWKRPTIERCDSLSHIQRIVEKLGEDSSKVEKIDRAVSQVFTPGLEHDKIRAQWVSNTQLKNMLKKV